MICLAVFMPFDAPMNVLQASTIVLAFLDIDFNAFRLFADNSKLFSARCHYRAFFSSARDSQNRMELKID
jgi:hypothetical protein